MADARTLFPRPRLARMGPLLLAALVVVFAGSKTVLFDSLDPDLFWHLRVADRLARDGVHPIVDDLSFASIHRPWTPYSWLAELGMREVWNAGGYRLAVAAGAAMIAATFALVALASSAFPVQSETQTIESPGGIAVALATAFGAVLALPYLSFRPVTAAVGLLAICAWLLLRDRRLDERSHAVWAVAPLTALIVNVHLFAFLVPVWVVALLAGAIWERCRCQSGDSAGVARPIRRYGLLLGLVLLACLMTPMLPGAVRTAFHYQVRDPMIGAPVIAETQPFWHGTAGKISLGLVVIFAVRVIRNHCRVRMGEKLWLLVGTGLLLEMGRLAPLFVLIAAPVMAATLPRFSDRVIRKPVVTMAMALVLGLCAWRIVREFPARAMILDAWLNRHGPDAPGYPTGAADFVERHIPPVTGRLINEFNWGGYLAWRLGDRFQVLLDGRTQLYSAELWKGTYLGSDEDRRAFFASVIADAAVLPLKKSQFQSTLELLGWVKIYEDERAVVLAPRNTMEITERNRDAPRGRGG